MSKYGEALDAMAADQRHQADLAADVASKYNPDQYAQAINESSRLGVSAQLFADNQDAKPSKYGQALDAENSPVTLDWLTSVDNAAVAQDDVESLSGLERTLRAIRKAYDINKRVNQFGRDLGASVSSEFVRTPGMILSGAGEIFEAGGRYAERGLRSVGGDWLADMLSVEAPWWVTPSSILQRPGEVIKGRASEIGVPEERQNLATDIAGGVGQLGAQALIQILTGGTSSAVTLFSQGADIMAERADEVGATDEQSDAAVLMGASITALTERYGLDKLLNRLPPQIKNAALRQITDIAIGGGIEAAQEAVEGVLHNLTAKALLDPNAPIFEGVEREAMAAGGAGAIARAVINAITPGRQVSFADQDRETAEQVSVAAQASKLATRSPQKLEELVAAISQETGSEFAYVDAAAFRTLFQSDQEAADAAAEMTGSSKTYFEAAVSNSKMAIPLAKYVTKIAADKNSASLLDHVTFSPEGLTAAEAQMEREGFEGRAKEIAEREVTEARPDTSQTVYDDVLGQLLATGMERSTAEKNAALTQAVFRTLGQRTGIDAQQLYQRYGLKVQREIPGAGTVKRVDASIDPLIDQLRSGDVPSPQQAFGTSLLEFIRAKGGLQDEGGELAARDVDKGGKAFQRNIIQKDGLTLDDMAEQLVEAGYITERDPNLVLDLISRELSGAPVYAAGNMNPVGAGRRAQVEWLEEMIGRAGLDPKTADNETIKKALNLNDERAALLDYLPSMEELTESGLAGVDEAFEVALVTRATELDAALVERLAVQYGEDDAGFLAAIRAFLNEQDAEAASRSEESTGTQEGLTSFDQRDPLDLLTLESVRTAWADAGIDNFIAESNGVITVSRIVVPKNARGQGRGSGAMRALVDYADATGQRIVLSPSTDFGGSSKSRLVQFYKRFGFVENKGRNRDFAVSESMIREPKKSVVRYDQSFDDIQRNEARAKPGTRFDQSKPPIGKDVERFLRDNLSSKDWNRFEPIVSAVSVGLPEYSQSTADQWRDAVRSHPSYKTISVERIASRLREMGRGGAANLALELGARGVNVSFDTSKSLGSNSTYLVAKAGDKAVKIRLSSHADTGAGVRTGHDPNDIDTTPNHWRSALKRAISALGVDDSVRLDQSPIPQTDTPEFRRWFGESKVVDDEGKPLVVYHGTKGDFAEFQLGRADRRDGGWFGDGFYLTASQDLASSYAMRERDHSLTDRPANVMPVYVRMSNPYRINLAELSYDEGSNFTKKYGGNEGFRKWLTDNGYDGVIGYRDPEIAGQGAGFWEVVVFDPTQIKSAIGNRGTFDPNSPSILEQSFDETKRGAIQFGKDRQFTISLLEKADLSTFLHESGHFYLEVMADLAEDANAPQQVKDDFATIMKWMGVKDRASIKTEHHEQWARGFEAYLMEGKSPSVEMQTVFARFRAWLVSVYKALTRLNVTLTEDVRRVMDRLVATDEEITAAEESQNYAPIFTTAEQAGMSPEEWAAYRDIAVRAHQEAVEDMTSHAMSQLTREQKAWWKEERASMAEAVTKEVNDNPTYQALAFLQKGKNADGTDLPDGVAAVKLSRAALEESYGKEFIKRLPRGTTAKDGVNPEIVAGMFDFRSGAALVEALANARPKAQLIEMEVDARMREKYGDMLTDGSLAEQAMKSVHTEARSKVMAAELRALNKKRQEVSKFIKATDQAKAREQRQAREANPLPDRQEMGAIKLAAQRAIQAKKIRAIQPNIYRVAEARAARKAFDLAGKGRFEEAYQEKRRQILNHELYKEAVKARAEVDLIVEYMRKFGKKSTRERLGKAKGEYLAQIDAILERFDFSNVSNIADLDRKSLLDWVEDQRSKGLEVAIPDYVLNEARRTPYKELILAELQGLHDAVKNIDHLSRLKNKLLASARKRDFDETVSSVVESIETHHERKQTPIDFAPGLGANIKKGVKKFFAEHTKMEFLFSWLDGEKELGPAWDAMFKPIADAENIEQAKMRDAREALTGILSKYSKAERAKLFVAKVHVPEVNANFTKASLLSVALNSGNQYNRDVMLRGYGWNDSQVNAILAKLDNRDWDVVEAIWGHVDSYWTDIAALQKDLTGLEPEKVEAAPFTAPNGRQIRGGYYPIKYDADTSERQMRQDEAQSVTDLFGGSFARIATKHGHTKARTDSGGKKVKLDLGVYTEHVTNVIHDLAFRRAVLDVDRIAQDDRVQSAIIDTAGREMYRQINPWLRSIAADYRQPMNTVEKVLNHARAGASIVSMGWKVTTAVVQPLGYLQSIEMIGTKYAGIGLKEFYGKGTPKAMGHARDFVFERSEQMRNRMTTFDRDVRDQLKGLKDRSTAVRRSFFYLTGAMDMSVSIPTWLGAYRKAMDGSVDGLKSGDEIAAIDFADSMVRKSQSAGGAKDLAGIQSGHPLFKLFTTFYSYFNVMYNMMARRYGMARAEGIMKHTPELVSSVMLLWFMPAVLSELIAQRGPEEDEDWGEWFLNDWRNWALYPFQGLVGVRDVISAMGPFGYDGPAAMEAFRAAGSVLNIPAKILDEDAEITRSDVRAALLAASYWGHLPGRQLWITGEYLYAYMTGEVDEFSLRDALFARPSD